MLLDPDTLAFLEGSPCWAVLSTHGPDGFPHTVPLGYMHHQGAFYMGCRDHTQKVKNIERDPRVSLLFSTSRQAETHRGVLVQGQARIVREQEELEPLYQHSARRRGKEYKPGTRREGFAYICVVPSKVIEWTL